MAFGTKEDGNLRNVVLTDVMRAGFEQQDGRTQVVWKVVPGDMFLIDYSHVRNLNITYFTLKAYDSALHSRSDDGHAKENPSSFPNLPQAP